ncbi:MAG: restriction endonuclease subunit S [Acidobacteria bacterium]|nr:restriction endonuclease subunit S [Acidobacteriota bacterium]MBI3655401.1 restriction endonuclease subunit S [Acidobacteriota bacterium]
MSASAGREQQRLKYVASINTETLTEETSPDYEMRYVDIGNVDSSGVIHEIATYRFDDAPSRARRVVRDGDVIISTVRTYLQAIAPIQESPENLIVSTGFAVVRPQASVFDPGFCKYALREPAFLAEVEMRSAGVSYPAINASDLGDIPIHLPTLQQQRAVAGYLDRETARLDALVAAKERLFGLLAEKRRALITRAVTRGLDARAPLRDSGIPWLGEIPVHWETKRLKHFATIYYGLSQPPEYVPCGVPFLRATNVKRGELFKDGLVYVDEADLPESRVVRLRSGDIIVVRSGAYTGDSAIVTEEWGGAVAGYDMVVRMARAAEPEYISLALLCQYVLEAQIDPLRLRAAQPHLNAEELGNIQFAIPLLSEQRDIVAYVGAETTKLDALRSATERTIALLKERRAALIAAAVTGQIDVKEVMANAR